MGSVELFHKHFDTTCHREMDKSVFIINILTLRVIRKWVNRSLS